MKKADETPLALEEGSLAVILNIWVSLPAPQHPRHPDVRPLADEAKGLSPESSMSAEYGIFGNHMASSFSPRHFSSQDFHRSYSCQSLRDQRRCVMHSVPVSQYIKERKPLT